MYLLKHIVEDTAFPFRLESSVHVEVSIDLSRRGLIVEPLTNQCRHRKQTSHEVSVRNLGFGHLVC